MYRKMLVAGIAILLAGMVVVPRVQASEVHQNVIFKVNHAIEIPGRALPPGTYQLRLEAFGSPIAEVCSAHCSHFYGFVDTQPVIRQHHLGRTTIKLTKAAPGAPPRVKEWFYPGDATGHELLYPPSTARYLARKNNTASTKQAG